MLNLRKFVLALKLQGCLANGTRPRNYGFSSAYLVGLIHGVGAETPTQVLLFIAAAGAAGQAVGAFLVLTFILGLLASNSVITLLSAFGFLRARRNTPSLLALGGLTAVFSLTVGTLFLLGQGSLLPAIFGGQAARVRSVSIQMRMNAGFLSAE